MHPGDTAQAFQLSLGCCMQHASCHMLQEQMLARVMAVAQLRQKQGGGGADSGASGGGAAGEGCSELLRWLEDHSSKAAADMAATKGERHASAAWSQPGIVTWDKLIWDKVYITV